MRLFTGFADEAADGIEGQVSVLKRMGWNSIELRAVDKVLAHDLSEDRFAKVADYLEENHITVACLGSGIANWSKPITEPFEVTQEVVRRTIVRMKRLKTNYVRIMSYKVIEDANGKILDEQQERERFRRLNWICEAFGDHGLIPVHENCHTYGGMSPDHTLRMLEHVPALKLVFDTGNPPITSDARTPYPYRPQDSYEFFSAVKEHIVHVHIKDALFADDGKTELYRFPGEGNGHVRKIVGELKRSGYAGYYSIEPHMEVVFHDSSAISNEEKRMQNFITYGQRFEKLLEEA